MQTNLIWESLKKYNQILMQKHKKYKNVSTVFGVCLCDFELSLDIYLHIYLYKYIVKF